MQQCEGLDRPNGGGPVDAICNDKVRTAGFLGEERIPEPVAIPGVGEALAALGHGIAFGEHDHG